MRRLLATAAVLAVSAAAAPSALAAPAETADTPRHRYVVRLNAADQAAARAAVLRASDLGAGWKGGLRKMPVQNPSLCSYFRPRANDIVITGAASSRFTTEGAWADAGVHVVQSPSMVALDWKRVVAAPAYMRCLREVLAKDLQRDGGRLVLFRRQPFPRVAPYVARFRAVAELPLELGRKTGVVLDFVHVGKGRTELTFTLAAPLVQLDEADKVEARLVRALVARMRA